MGRLGGRKEKWYNYILIMRNKIILKTSKYINMHLFLYVTKLQSVLLYILLYFKKKCDNGPYFLILQITTFRFKLKDSAL